MLAVAVRGQAQIDEAVRPLILARVESAHRLATWILQDPSAAEDAVQQAALQAWERRGSLRDPAVVDAWFNRILVNVCKDELRRRARRPAVGAIDVAVGGHQDRSANMDELSRAIARLTPDEQIVLALRFGRDLTVPQIAAETGIPEGTVKSRIHHALAHLRSALQAERRAAEGYL